MIFECLKLNMDIDDNAFNKIYPENIKALSQRHWTPVDVAKMAAKYLVDNTGKKVLDIESGAGKFCLVGAASTDGIFYGVEQRASLTKISKKIADKHNISNVDFINLNIKEISFLEYEAFYFFNSFYENIDTSCSIDDTIIHDIDLYYDYSEYVREQLDATPIGTRLVTYWSKWDEIPNSFNLIDTACDKLLNFWEKVM